MDYSRIPEKLKNLNQWVCCWDNSKIPMKAYEKRAASSSSPETWSSFEQASFAVDKGYYDHVGFVFADNNIVGIDIDAGFDENGLMTPLCADIMSVCHSYTEKSRSGRGVHILVNGNLPFTGRNNLHGVEIYKSRRFFIMTGKDLIFNDMIENQAAIDYVVNKYFPETPKSNNRPFTNRKIYEPIYDKPENGKISLKPTYPPILEGCRNLSLTSLAGTMHNIGFTKKQIYQELCHVNNTKCNPPLDNREVQAIVESVTRYER